MSGLFEKKVGYFSLSASGSSGSSGSSGPSACGWILRPSEENKSAGNVLYNTLGQWRRVSTRRRLIGRPPSIQPSRRAPATSFCPAEHLAERAASPGGGWWTAPNHGRQWHQQQRNKNEDKKSTRNVKSPQQSRAKNARKITKIIALIFKKNEIILCKYWQGKKN